MLKDINFYHLPEDIKKLIQTEDQILEKDFPKKYSKSSDGKFEEQEEEIIVPLEQRDETLSKLRKLL